MNRGLTVTLCAAFTALPVPQSAHSQGPAADPLTPQQRQELQATGKQLSKVVLSLYREGRFDQALVKAEKAVEIFRRLHGGEVHRNLANAVKNAGAVLLEQGRLDEALRHYDDALAMSRR